MTQYLALFFSDQGEKQLARTAQGGDDFVLGLSAVGKISEGDTMHGINGFDILRLFGTDQHGFWRFGGPEVYQYNPMVCTTNCSVARQSLTQMS